ncbi:MAG: hypothetical protein QM692_10095 [Thermomicrobiales bacterium]
MSNLVWDDWNLDHITKHGVTRAEVEEVIFSAVAVFPSYKNRLKFVGWSSLGRIVSVVIGQVPDTETAYYVFSARPASRKERRELTSFQDDHQP